jgi:hypothetical protein
MQNLRPNSILVYINDYTSSSDSESESNDDPNINAPRISHEPNTRPATRPANIQNLILPAIGPRLMSNIENNERHSVERQPSERQHNEVQPSEQQHNERQHNEAQPSDAQHNEAQPSEASGNKPQDINLPHNPPEIIQNTISVMNVENNGVLCGYSNKGEFIYGYATVADVDDIDPLQSNHIYYYKSVIIRDDEIIITSNDNYILIRHNDLIIDSILYIGSVDNTELRITFGPDWNIKRTDTNTTSVILHINSTMHFIGNRSRSYSTMINTEFFAKRHNFLELDNIQIAPAFDRIINNAKYREMYKIAINLKKGEPKKKLEDSRCIICMNHPPLYALECGHLLYCEHCQSQTSTIKRRRVEYICPLCNTTHYSLKRIYY